MAFFNSDARPLTAYIQERLGLDFRYREDELRRRISPQMDAAHCSSFAEYALFLRNGDSGVRPDLAAFDAAVGYSHTTYDCNAAAVDRVLHHLVSVNSRLFDRGLRVLSAGCGDGGEAFLFVQRVKKHPAFRNSEIEVLGIDISSDAVQRASTLSGESVYSQDIRRHCRFRSANILEPDSYSDAGPFDVILCRNVLVYFNFSAQEKACFGFTTVLADHGLIMIGEADSAVSAGRYFAALSDDPRILYQKTFRTSRLLTHNENQGAASPL